MSQRQHRRSSRPQFGGAYIRLERARQHIELLHHPSRFLGRELLEMRLETKTNPRTGEDVLWFRPRDHRVLLRLGATVGDAVHNLRATLDNAIWWLSWLNQGQPGAAFDLSGRWRKIAFPIFAQNPKTVPWSMDPPESLWAVHPLVAAAVEKVQPFRTGDNHLERFSSLSNVDKHRTIQVVGMQTDAVKVDSDEIGDIYRLPSGVEIGRQRGEQGLIDDEGKFSFEVVFDEGHIAFGEPVVETLEEILTTVTQVYEELRNVYFNEIPR